MRFLALSAAFFLSILSGAPALAAYDPLVPQFQGALEKAKAGLGKLTDAQEEIFEKEVLAASGRFIRDYSGPTNKLTRIEVDTDALRRYLSLKAEDVVKPEQDKILILVEANKDCTPCVGAVPDVRKDWQERLERRGFKAIPVNLEESKRNAADLLGIKKANGWIRLSIVSIEDPDHPGDSKYRLGAEVRIPGTLIADFSRQQEILPSESISVNLIRLAIETLSEMGARVQKAQMASLEAEGNEGTEIQITGLTEFNQLYSIKSAIQGVFKGDGKAVEKRLCPGEPAALALFTSKTIPQIIAMLKFLVLENGKLSVESNIDGVIHVKYTSTEVPS